jgi:predicted O-methyltransferase YrrM
MNSPFSKMYNLCSYIDSNTKPDEWENFIQYMNIFQKGNMECSTGIADCALLYGLVRYIKPINILEIGTFVGSTCYAMKLGCEKNQGKHLITTIDRDQSNIKKSEMGDLSFLTILEGEAKQILEDQNCTYDFIFADANIDEKTASLLEPLMSRNVVFVTHDYNPQDKGIEALENIATNTFLGESIKVEPDPEQCWITNPGGNHSRVNCNAGVNNGCALLVSQSSPISKLL